MRGWYYSRESPTFGLKDCCTSIWQQYRWSWGIFRTVFNTHNELSFYPNSLGTFGPRVAAVINIAQVLTWKGELQAAKRYIAQALEIAKSNRLLVRSALDSLANLLITSGDLSESREVFQRLEELGDRRERRPHWDEATELYSQARLAQAEGNFQGAIDLLDRALEIAQSCGDQIWSGGSGHLERIAWVSRDANMMRSRTWKRYTEPKSETPNL